MDHGAASRLSSSPRLNWVDWFNNRRLLEPIGNIPPAEAEERYYAMLEEPGHGSVTQTKRPPANPVRFSSVKARRVQAVFRQ